MDLLVRAATPLFIVLLIVVLALGTSAVVNGWSKALDGHSLTSGPSDDKGLTTGLMMPEPDRFEPSMHSLVLHRARPAVLACLWVNLFCSD